MADVGGPSWLRLAVAMAVVLGLLATLGFALKYVSMRGLRLPGLPQRNRRLLVVEMLPLDARRRLAIIKCDDSEHLLLLGPERDIVVATNLSIPSIPPAPPAP